MSIMIWNPFQEMRRLEKEIDRTFRSFNGEKLSLSDKIFSPLTDVKETDDEIIIETNLPGIKKDDLKIEATPDGVTIKAELNGKREHKEDGTTLKDGVLTLHFPKSEEHKPVKLIPNDSI